MLKKLLLVTTLSVGAFAMHLGELNINERDLEIGAKFDLGQFNDTIEPNTMFLGAKFLNADQENSDANTTLEPYYEVNYLIMKKIGDNGMKIGMGAKFNYTQDFSSLPLGLEFAYTIPAKNLIPMTLNGSLYYAPQALSFSDAQEFLEYRVSYDMEIIKNAAVTVGFRKINTTYVPEKVEKSGMVNYNTSWFAGFKINF